jgi:hypothetical protein
MPHNSQYKDSVFTLLFSDKNRLRELYNAIADTSYGEETEISINTLNNVLFMERINDMSFTIGNKLVILLEHQSTVNPNMPLRFLLYIARIYEKIIENKSLYKQTLAPVPAPDFIVLYNGTAPQPDRRILRLSDAFIAGDMPKAGSLELAVTVLNINSGRNEAILTRSKELGEYAAFVEKVRELERTCSREEALKRAVKYGIEHNILRGFLTEHGSEVVNMLLTEWNWEDAKEVWQEEARAEGEVRGIEIGETRGRSEGIEIGETRGEARILELLKAEGYDTAKLEEQLKHT